MPYVKIRNTDESANPRRLSRVLDSMVHLHVVSIELFLCLSGGVQSYLVKTREAIFRHEVAHLNV